ncbi:MAG: 16S rRNA (cytosine(967)-C(5))-methyltransferase RsmB [Lachnospiraceae bacterium]
MAESDRNARNTVLWMLGETLGKGRLSHMVVNETFETEAFNPRDRAFISRLYLGVLERLIYLDYVINRHSAVNTANMKPDVLNILRMGAYQLLFMDGVPDFAAINESVELASKCLPAHLKAFVNGVLRSIQRGRDDEMPDMPPNVRLSVPKWIYEMVVGDYGMAAAVDFFEGALDENKRVTIRFNRAAAGTGEITALLEKEGCSVAPVDEEAGVYRLWNFESLTGLRAYKEGLFIVQDYSSVRAAMACVFALKRAGIDSPLILDVCAAPGGKTMCMAEHFPNGRIIARDISGAKTALIKENAERLGLENISIQIHDALVFDGTLKEKVDLVIADLPCSGLGVIGGKPDIKFRIRPDDINELSRLQNDILDVVQGYVGKGGYIMYSTCTICKAENEDNASEFAERHGYELIREEKLLPKDADGFYFALMKKK